MLDGKDRADKTGPVLLLVTLTSPGALDKPESAICFNHVRTLPTFAGLTLLMPTIVSTQAVKMRMVCFSLLFFFFVFFAFKQKEYMNCARKFLSRCSRTSVACR